MAETNCTLARFYTSESIRGVFQELNCLLMIMRHLQRWFERIAEREAVQRGFAVPA